MTKQELSAGEVHEHKEEGSGLSKALKGRGRRVDSHMVTEVVFLFVLF